MSMMRIVAATWAETVCLFALIWADPASAQSAQQRFRPYDGAAHIDASQLAVQHAAHKVQVVVVMSEDSVATARAKSATPYDRRC